MNRVICSIKLEEYSKKESGINEEKIIITISVILGIIIGGSLVWY